MKKLKLIGRKIDEPPGKTAAREIAVIYVKDGKVFVESDNETVRKQILGAIEQGAYSVGFLLSETVETPGKRCTVEDPDFLKALTYSRMWQREFDGWYVLIGAARIVDQ